MNKPHYLPFDQAMREKRRQITVLIGQAKSEKERQFWKLQLALSEPFASWFSEARHVLKGGDLAEVIGNALAGPAVEAAHSAATADLQRAFKTIVAERFIDDILNAPGMEIARVRDHDA